MSCPSPAKLEAVIRTVMPLCKEPALWARYIGEATAMHEITEDDRLDDFLAQIAVESGELNVIRENLNYSAARLRAVWPKRFPTDMIAARYANNPDELANYVYGGRGGNYLPGDGARFYGRGLIMVTFRENYIRMSALLGLDLITNPELLAQPRYAALSAAAYWKHHGLNELAEARAGDNAAADFLTITKAVQGGTEGLTKRQLYWTRARNALGLAGVM